MTFWRGEASKFLEVSKDLVVLVGRRVKAVILANLALARMAIFAAVRPYAVSKSRLI